MGIEVRSHRGPPKPDMDFPVIKVKLDEVLPHEQTIPDELEWFKDSVSRDQSIFWPMLIGSRNHTILDGHHRAAGLKALNYLEAPAILIDYYDDDLIQLDTWYPLVKQPLSIIINRLEEIGLKIEEFEPSEFSRAKLDDRKTTAFVGTENRMYKVTGDRELIFKEVRDLWLHEITYYDDPEMCLENTDNEHTAIVSWSYTKEEIISHVRQGIVHLPKTTRHTLKYNVPRGQYPLSDLAKKE